MTLKNKSANCKVEVDAKSNIPLATIPGIIEDSSGKVLTLGDVEDDVFKVVPECISQEAASQLWTLTAEHLFVSKMRKYTVEEKVLRVPENGEEGFIEGDHGMVLDCLVSCTTSDKEVDFVP